MLEVYCKQCNKKFKSKNPQHVFCSDACCSKWNFHNNPKIKKYVWEYTHRPEVIDRHSEQMKKWQRKFREENGYWYSDRWRDEHAGKRLEGICRKMGFPPKTISAMVLDGKALDKRLKELRGNAKDNEVI